jgi:pimeloyl-ACP methyl ester carboxylesterase
MQEAIETRELIMLDGPDGDIRGTYHRPYEGSFYPQSLPIAPGRIGVLFLNSTSPTRAQNGDAAVYLADSFASCGYPSFRIDLPGFGDSHGEPSADVVDLINRGGYASIASAKARELVARFNLSGVVFAGHCAGAISALYAAATSSECRGLILIGPYFHLPQARKPTKIQQQLTLWALKSRLGKLFHKSYGVLKVIRIFLRRSGLPANANNALLRCWKNLASSGLPILILKAPNRKASGMKPRAAEFDYFKYALKIATRKSKVVVGVTEGANNAFANSVGREAVRQHSEQWLKLCFPLKVSGASDTDSLCREPGNRKSEHKNREQCLKV